MAEDRLVEADEAGAAWTATPDRARDADGKQDIVFITAGAPGAFELALDLCDDAGAIVLYTAFPKDMTATVGLDLLHHHEISVIGVYSQEPEDWRTAAGLLRSGVLGPDLDRLVTGRYGLDTVADALTLATTSPVYRVLVGQDTGA